MGISHTLSLLLEFAISMLQVYLVNCNNLFGVQTLKSEGCEEEAKMIDGILVLVFLCIVSRCKIVIIQVHSLSLCSIRQCILGDFSVR